MARKKDIEEKDAALVVEEADASEARVYELAFHLDPELSQDEVKRTYQGIREGIAAQGTIVAEGEPEKMQLAYTISRQENTGRKDFDSAYFCWIAYEIPGEGHTTVLEAIKAEKRVVRFLDIKTTKEEAKHSAEMQELRAKTAEKGTEGEETVSDAQLDAALEEVVAP
ncbi:MAG: 30S ribosomal protein S6 [Minisyncoccia bacterium]